MRTQKSQAWKDLERTAADVVGGERITTPWFLFEERPDAIATLPDGRRLICECKYRTRFSHHSILDDCQARYCQGDDVPCLVTKHHNQTGAYVTIPLDVLATLLKDYHPGVKGVNHE